MEEIIQIIFIILNLKSVSKVTQVAIKNLGLRITNLINEITKVSHRLYEGGKVFKLSSGDSFNQNLVNWMQDVDNENLNFDIRNRLLEIIDSIDSKILKFRIKNGIDTLQSKISIILSKELEKHLAEYVTKEILEIEESLGGDCFFNLTNAPVSKDLREKLNLGKKYSPFLKINKGKELQMFEQEISNLFMSYMKAEFKLEIVLSPKSINKDLNKMVKYLKRTRNSDLERFINKFRKVYNEVKSLFKKQLENCSSTSHPNYKNFEKTFELSDDKIIVEADKNVGYVCLYKTDLLDQYTKINIQQHFGAVNITEEWYLVNIVKFIKDAEKNLPMELSKIVLKKDFIWNETSEIGVLRLQPKVLKLKAINYENVINLTSRGIKSSMKDPIKVIQKILDKIFNHLLFHIEETFNSRFGLLSPSVTGVNEAMERIKNSKTGPWGRSIELEGDFSDLYSNCNQNLLTECVKKACRYANLHESTFQYIKLLIDSIMTHSYFKEPTGIFKTLKGFSMGDCSAARGSEIILRMYEMKMFSNLARKNLLKNVLRFLRFRDDVSVHITGSDLELFQVMQIIGSGYPPCIIFNIESKITHGKFLNIRIYNNPETREPYTTVLRKAQNKYNIIPPKSNTHPKFKRMAGLGYFRTVRTHCSTQKEIQNQFKVVYAILKCKGFNKQQIKRMEKFKTGKIKEMKRFLSKTTYDSTSRRHEYILRTFKGCGIDPQKYYQPMEVSGKKLEQIIFTVRKMRKKLNF